MNWINKNVMILAIIAIVLSLFWIILGPLILSQNYFSLIDFSCGSKIGETIGGIAAPIVGFVSSILLFLALVKQMESNKIAVDEANFRIIYAEIGDLKNASENFLFNENIGNEAIRTFVANIFVNYILLSKKDDGKVFNQLNKFELLIMKFSRIFYLIDNLKTSSEYKRFLLKDILNIYNIYFYEAFKVILDLNTNYIDETIKGKLDSIKGTIITVNLYFQKHS
jgi:hypothetical protein